MDNNSTEDLTPRSSELAAVCSAALLIRFLIYCCAWYFNPQTPDRFESFVGIWKRWDALHYLSIATHGYLDPGADAAALAFVSRFPPLYPLLIRTLGSVEILGQFYAAIILSIISICAASGTLYALLRHEGEDRQTAWFAVLMLNCWPSAYFANSAHSEALFLLLSILYFYFIRVRQNYFFGGCFATLMLLTRQAGVALLPLHGVLFIRKLFARTAGIRDCIALLLPIAAYSLFLLYVRKLLGLPGYFGEDAWAVKFSFPFEESYRAVLQLANSDSWQDRFFMFNVAVPQCSLLIAALLVLFGTRRLPFDYSLYGICCIAMLSVIHWNISALRYTFALFTLPWIVARVRPSWLRYPLLILSAAMLVFCLRIYVLEWMLL